MDKLDKVRKANPEGSLSLCRKLGKLSSQKWWMRKAWMLVLLIVSVNMSSTTVRSGLALSRLTADAGQRDLVAKLKQDAELYGNAMAKEGVDGYTSTTDCI